MVTLNAELRHRALLYATYNKESTDETIEAALNEFIKNPSLTVSTGFGTTPARTFDGLPYLDGPRDEIRISQELQVAAMECAKAMGLSLDQVLDLAVANACPPIGTDDVSWMIR